MKFLQGFCLFYAVVIGIIVAVVMGLFVYRLLAP